MFKQTSVIEEWMVATCHRYASYLSPLKDIMLFLRNLLCDDTLENN
jgi:hypothetical protein